MKTVLGALLACGLVLAAAPSRAQPSGADRLGPSNPAGSDEIVLTFKGRIDGSDQIKITPTRAIWHHKYWDFPPEPVTLNGVSWGPQEQPVLKNEGTTRFLTRPVDFRSARLNRIEGRDTVALERSKDFVVVHISDTPFEPSPYEFQLIFKPRDGDTGAKAGGGNAGRPRSKHATLRIVAEIDGSDELRINEQGARWVHRQWGWPGMVRLNRTEWDPEESPTLKNEGATRFLDGPVDFTTAKLIKRDGRDLAVLEQTDGGLVVYFADSPDGGSVYDVTITFGGD